MSISKETLIWFIPHLLITSGGVGFDCTARYLEIIRDLPPSIQEFLLRSLKHYDADEKVLVVNNRRYDFIQKIFSKENLNLLLNQSSIQDELQQFQIPVSEINDTESGMNQSPLLTDLLGMMLHDEIESDLRKLLREGFGCLGKLSQTLSRYHYAVHPRAIIWVIFGSGGGVGPALGRRIGEILRQFKLSGELPPVSIIALVPLASVYNIDAEKKSRAFAINRVLFSSLNYRMNGQSYPVHKRRGDRLRTEYQNGLFDFIITFGEGQDQEILNYNNVIDQMTELICQTGFGGSGVEFLAMLANETRLSEFKGAGYGHER